MGPIISMSTSSIRISHIPEGETIIALLVGGQGKDGCAILLVPAQESIGEYERVGIVRLEKKDFEFAKEIDCRCNLMLQ